MKLLPHAVATPLAVVMVHRRPRRKVARQHPPRTPRPTQIENTVDHRPHVGRLRSPASLARLGPRNQWGNQVPLLIREIAGVCVPGHNPVLSARTEVFIHFLRDNSVPWGP